MSTSQHSDSGLVSSGNRAVNLWNIGLHADTVSVGPFGISKKEEPKKDRVMNATPSTPCVGCSSVSSGSSCGLLARCPKPLYDVNDAVE